MYYITSGVGQVCLDEVEHPEEMRNAREAVKLAVTQLDVSADDARIVEQARLAVRRTFFKSRGKKPMTVVHVRRST